jgi:hypothetical protein
MLLILATIAVTLSMYDGIGSIVAYRLNAGAVKEYREDAAAWELADDTERAADMRRMAKEAAEFDRACLASAITTAVLVGIGVTSGALGFALRALSGARHPGPTSLADKLARVCLTTSAVLMSGLILGGFLYVGLSLLYRFLSE